MGHGREKVKVKVMPLRSSLISSADICPSLFFNSKTWPRSRSCHEGQGFQLSSTDICPSFFFPTKQTWHFFFHLDVEQHCSRWASQDVVHASFQPRVARLSHQPELQHAHHGHPQQLGLSSGGKVCHLLWHVVLAVTLGQITFWHMA